jgi:hypothetical protein
MIGTRTICFHLAKGFAGWKAIEEQDSEMSAWCCMRGSTLVNLDGANSRLPTLTVRLAPEEKQRFRELAASRGKSEAALALSMVRACLAALGPSAPAVSTITPHAPATDRITIRLRPGDGAALDARAARRSMKASTYLAALVRAHLAANPPLAAEELRALKQAVVVLAKVGGALALIARRGAQEGLLAPELRQELAQVRRAVAAVERRTSDLARAALRSWESRHE